MFVEAVIFLSVIIGVLLALSSFVFHILTREHHKPGEWREEIEGAVDAVCDAALDEINKTSKLVLDELDEKYKALLFVYQLMDDKEKALTGGDLEAANEVQAEAGHVGADLRDIDISIGDELDVVPVDLEAAAIRELLSKESLDEEFPVEESLLEGPQVDEPQVDGLQVNELQVNELLTGLPLSEKLAAEVPAVPRIAFHPKYAAIKELMDGGLGIAEIARRLDMGQGEVQLIIGFSGRT